MLGGKTTVPILTHRGEVIFSALFWRDGEMAIFDFDIGLTTGFFRESGYKGDWGITASHVELSLQFFDNAFGPTTIH